MFLRNFSFQFVTVLLTVDALAKDGVRVGDGVGHVEERRHAALPDPHFDDERYGRRAGRWKASRSEPPAKHRDFCTVESFACSSPPNTLQTRCLMSITPKCDGEICLNQMKLRTLWFNVCHVQAFLPGPLLPLVKLYRLPQAVP